MILLLLTAALAEPIIERTTDHLGYTATVSKNGAEILGFYPVLSGVPDIVPEVAVPLLRFSDAPDIGGTVALHVARSAVLEAHWPGRMILRGVHDTTHFEYPRLASLVVVADGVPHRVTEWLFRHDGWPEFLATFEGAQLGDDSADVAVALAAMLQPMADPAGIHPAPLVARHVAGGLEVTLSASPNWLVVLAMGLEQGRLTDLSIVQRRPETP